MSAALVDPKALWSERQYAGVVARDDCLTIDEVRFVPVALLGEKCEEGMLRDAQNGSALARKLMGGQVVQETSRTDPEMMLNPHHQTSDASAPF